jgi:hypothetical protein
MALISKCIILLIVTCIPRRRAALSGHRGVIGQKRACMLQENQVPSAVYEHSSEQRYLSFMNDQNLC